MEVYKLNSVVRDGSVRLEGWVLFIQAKLSCVRWKCTPGRVGSLQTKLSCVCELCEMEVYALKGGFSSYKLNSVV